MSTHGKTKVLVITGDGINCERESARAFNDAGGESTILHVNALLDQPKLLREFSVFCIPGGFSFGDELRSGKILAEKMRVRLPEELELFVNKGGFTIGICNGFQVLIQLGAFSGIRGHRKITLATNDHGAFLDRWVGLELTDCAKKSDWFRDLSGTFYMPMRHKEGRIVLKDESTQVLFPLRYEEEVNGSYARSAAVLDQSGRTLGMMPHPEAATHGFLSPLRQTTEEKKLNARKVQKIFENAIQGAKS